MSRDLAAGRADAQFRILRLLEERPDASQREIARDLGISLGAVNYCLRALLEKGHVRLANFRASTNKLGYVYVLTPEGLGHRAHLAIRFIERKVAEYEAIRRELDDFWTRHGHELAPGAGVDVAGMDGVVQAAEEIRRAERERVLAHIADLMRRHDIALDEVVRAQCAVPAVG